MATKSSGNALSILHVSVAAFFLLIGLVGIIQYSSDAQTFGRSVVRAFGGSNDLIGIIVSILLLLSGLLLLLGLFLKVKTNLMKSATLIIFVIWTLRILLVFFLNDIFEPDFLVWLQGLSLDVIVLVSVWLINRKYA